MLYVAGRFLFIHIPRTMGNSISRSLTQELVTHSHPCLVTTSLGQFTRHSTAAQLKHLLPNFDKLVKLAVDRPYWDIVTSDYALHRRAVLNRESLPDWAASVKLARVETLEHFEKRRWRPWLKGKSIWEHWCCDESAQELNVVKIPFAEVPKKWEEICSMAGCQQVPELLKFEQA